MLQVVHLWGVSQHITLFVDLKNKNYKILTVFVILLWNTSFTKILFQKYFALVVCKLKTKSGNRFSKILKSRQNKSENEIDMVWYHKDKVVWITSAGADRGGCGWRPLLFFFGRDKASDLVWTPQAKKCTKQCELSLIFFSLSASEGAHPPQTPTGAKFCQSLIWVPLFKKKKILDPYLALKFCQSLIFFKILDPPLVCMGYGYLQDRWTHSHSGNRFSGI